MALIFGAATEGPEAAAIPHAFQQPQDCPAAECAAILQGRQELETLQATVLDLRAAVAQEQRLLEEQQALVRQTALFAQESDHRLLNGLQLVASLLAMQARTSVDPEVTAQLSTAARRVATIGSLHRRLHGLDEAERVELAEYLPNVCQEVVEMIAIDRRDAMISFSGVPLLVPRMVGIRLGFIVAELLTNAAKYATGEISVVLAGAEPGRYSLSVIDQGQGLPEGFHPTAGRGLGMKIVASLVREIRGELGFGAGDDGRGTRFTVRFEADGAPA